MLLSAAEMGPGADAEAGREEEMVGEGFRVDVLPFGRS